MQLVVVGINQQTAPVALRERLAISPARLPEALARLHQVAAEGFLLSTCNRVEAVALVGQAEAGALSLIRVLAAQGGLPVEAIAPHCDIHTDAAAVRHLFAVAAGLDSLVLGEDQILAQLKTALATAQAAQALGPVLHRLGHTALATGKQVRSRTALSRQHLSIVSVALSLAAAELGDLCRRTILVLGAGQMAELTLKHLAKRPPARITVVSRRAEQAAALAARYRGQAGTWPLLDGALAESDVVISCTSAPEAVLDAARIGRALAQRPTRPLLALDLAVPRDIDPASATLPGVTLYDVDSLQAICAGHRQQRAGEIGQAEALIAVAAEQFMSWWRARTVVPTITALRAQAEAIREAELARALARLPDLTPEEAATVRYLATALVNKLLHAPVTALRSTPDAGLTRAAEHLFALPGPAVPVASRPEPPGAARLPTPPIPSTLSPGLPDPQFPPI
jgi:glutamyl-tRNA reductase